MGAVVPKGRVRGFVERYLGTLRFPWLFGLTATLFLLDLVFPDVLPFADEVLLGLTTALLGRLRRAGPKP